jgi:hypothetical protein
MNSLNQCRTNQVIQLMYVWELSTLNSSCVTEFLLLLSVSLIQIHHKPLLFGSRGFKSP